MGGFALPARTIVRSTKPVTLDMTDCEKKTHLCLQKTPFANLCRDIVQVYIVKTGLRFRAQSLLSLQEAAEAHMITFLAQANKVVLHSRRVTVGAADLRLVHSMESSVDFEEDKDKRERKLTKTPKANLKRLFDAAKIERASADLYTESAKCLNTFLLAVLSNINSIVQSRRTSSVCKTVSPTVTLSDVSYALQTVNSKVYGLAAAKR